MANTTELLLPDPQARELNVNVLYNRFNPQLFALALKVCGNAPDAEDAVHDAWIAAYMNIHQVRNPDSVLPWLKRIVYNNCFQLLRKNKRSPLTDILPENANLIEESVEQKFEQISCRDSLYSALATLPVDLRQTIILRYLCDYNSYNQIAEITGVPVGTVRSRLNDSKKRLTKLWQDQPDPGDKEFLAATYWNSFYKEICPGAYMHANLLSELIGHVHPDIKLVFTSGKMAIGKDIFEGSIIDDLEHGSYIAEVESCITSGGLSVLQVSFKNDPEFPTHCPPSSYLTFYRQNGKLVQMNLYHAARQIVTSEFC